MASERSKKAAMSAMMSIRGSAASRLCMTMTGTRWRATTSAISGSRCRPQTSLTIAAPRSSAQAAIVAFIVSIETGCPEHTTAGSTNSSRRSSSSAETATAWGRVDSAPMSMMSTPSIIICLACATAASRGRKAPPSENESGVTFSIPMTNGRRSASRAERTSAFAACRVVNAPETGGDVAIMARMCAVAHAVSSETAPAFSRFSGTRSSGIEPAHGALPILTCIVRSRPRRALSRAMTHESWLLLPSVRNFHRKLFGVVDPALDCVLRGQYANEFSDRVCLRHRLSEPRRIPNFFISIAKLGPRPPSSEIEEGMITPKPGWHVSNELAEAWNGVYDRVDIVIACLVAGIRDQLARNAFNLAHVQPCRHQPTADAHNSAHAGKHSVATFSLRRCNRFGGAGQAYEQGLHGVGRTFSCQEIENDPHGSFSNRSVNAYIDDDLVDELVHWPPRSSCSASKIQEILRTTSG